MKPGGLLFFTLFECEYRKATRNRPWDQSSQIFRFSFLIEQSIAHEINELPELIFRQRQRGNENLINSC